MGALTANEEIRQLAETCDALRQELAASTAREERLREALVDVLGRMPAMVTERQHQAYERARAVLAETAAREGAG